MNCLFKVKVENGITSEDIKNPSENVRFSFEDLYVLRTSIETLDRANSVQEMDNCQQYFADVETLVESVLLDLRVTFNLY